MVNKIEQASDSATELTRTALDFSWTMSLFAAQQMSNLLTPSKAAASFDNVAQAMKSELTSTFYSAYQSGESVQNQLANFMSGAFAQPLRSAGERVGDVVEGSWRPINGQYDGHSTSQQNQTFQPPNSSSSPGGGTNPGRATGWGPMPFPVVPPQPDSPHRGAQATPSSQPISSDYPFKPNYAEVFGSKMHYIDVGSGDPILFLHGNPTWSYLWRNIIPHLAPLGRCIAPDLIGFGRSDKPDIGYSWQDQSRYLEEFIKKMGLRNVTLVLHDQGSGLGFHYAMRNERNIKGIAFFEAIIRPYRWDQFSTPEFRELFKAFRTGGEGGQGWKMIVEDNFFIEQLLPTSAGRTLSEVEMNYYREPFPDQRSRRPIWKFPNETPIGGEPKAVWDAVTTYSRKLQKSNLPKLMLYAKPGALITDEHANWAKQNIRNLESEYVGEGTHFLQESNPHEIGKAVARWVRKLPGNSHLSRQESGGSGSPGSGPHSGPGISAQSIQRLIDQAAYFNFQSKSPTTSPIRGERGIVGFEITENLNRFGSGQHSGNGAIGTISHRWMVAPDGWIAKPGHTPPPTPLNETIGQRMVLMDGHCRMGKGRDSFRGFGTAQTFPTNLDGRNRLFVCSVGTIVSGQGRFEGHQQGTYVTCGELDRTNGFTGNIMLRVMDEQRTLHSSTNSSANGWQIASDKESTYIIFRGEALPADPVRPKIGPEGKPIGLIVEQGLKIQQTINDGDSSGVRSTTRIGKRRIGRVTAHVVFDPTSANGTNDDPVPFTAYDEFEFIGRDGQLAGKFFAETSDGRVFNTLLSGQQGIRFGGVGKILRGEGIFEGISGLMTDNSVVCFEPHVSASVYVLRIQDRDGRIQSALEAIS